MTTHITLADYHRALADGQVRGARKPTIDQARKQRGTCPGCARLTALLGLVRQLGEGGLVVHLEHRFHPERRWRFDVAVWVGPPDGRKIGLEIDGYGQAHYGIKGRANDNEKDAEAQRLGWTVLRVAWEHVLNGEALELIRRAAGSEVTP
jgi:hypothetical protein